MFNRILVAVDLAYADPQSKVLSVAAELAGKSGAELRLVYVRYMVETAIPYIPAETLASDERSAKAKLRELAAAMPIDQSKISTDSPIGRAYSEVIAAAKDFEADLIVIGPHSPSMAKFLLGSDAGRIVHNAQVSVLVVR